MTQPASFGYNTNFIKAWANFNGTLTGTNKPRSGFGITSVTRTAAGAYTVNFDFTMPDTNYGILVFTGSDGSSVMSYYEDGTFSQARTTKTCKIAVANPGTSVQVDRQSITIAILGFF